MRVGIDLGGTKIEIIALDQQGQSILRQRIDTPQGDYQATIQAITALIKQAEKSLGQQGSVGIATPGAISMATGRLKNSNSVCLNDQPIKQDLEAALRRELRLSNDANCFALSEAVDGAAAGSQNVFGVILGTGVGGGIVINGQVLEGANAIAGEWGHNPLPWPQTDELPGEQCYCGQHGCIETFLSGPALVRDYVVKTPSESVNRVQQICTLAEQGEAAAQAALSIYAERLAKALAQIINIIDPEVIVLGGGLSNITMLYDTVPQLWTQWVFSDQVNTKLLPPVHGDSSGVRGAAWLWK